MDDVIIAYPHGDTGTVVVHTKKANSLNETAATKTIKGAGYKLRSFKQSKGAKSSS